MKTKKVMTNCTIDELEKLILFDVELFDAKDVLPGYKHQNDNSKILIDTSNDRILNYCSPQYTLERNSEFIIPMYNELSKFYEVDIEYRIENNARFFVDFKIANRDIEIIKGDKVNPVVSFQNSYNNSLKRSYGLYYYRQVCTNGMMGFLAEFEESRKHSGNFNVDFDLIHNHLNPNRLHNEKFAILTDRQLSRQEAEKIVKTVEDNPKFSFPKRLLSDVITQAKKEAEQLGEKNLSSWLLYNGFNYQLNHADIKLAYDTRVKIDKKLLNFLVNQ